jgi:O-antigen/teichoic acid export membrane protein
MLARLKSTLRDTLVYSLSNIAPKIVGVVLLPLYTAKLALGEFGNWDLLDITISILAEIFILGQATSVILFNNSEEYGEKKESALFTITSFILLICGVFVIAAVSVTSFFPEFFAGTQIGVSYIRLISYIVLLRVMNNLFLAKVRADGQAGFYTTVSVFKILVTTGITIYFVGFLEWKIEGIFYAAVIAEFLGLLILSARIVPHLKMKFDPHILSAALKFGLPLVFASIGFLFLNLSDRYIIKFLLGSSALAPYGLAYRVAGVLNMFLVLPFTLGLMPVAYKYFGSRDDTRFFSKLMTYSTFFFIWGFVFLSLFSREIIYIFADKKEYYGSYLIVPLILLSYVFSGMRLTASLGMLLTKNTKHIAWITICAAVLNIILNFIFIPEYGVAAAAMSTLVSFIIFYLVTQLLSGRYYKIPYENGKLLLMIAAGSVLAGLIYFLPAMNLFAGIILKLFIVISFPVILFFFRFYEKAELEILLSPSKLMDLIKGTLTGAGSGPANSGQILQ